MPPNFELCKKITAITPMAMQLTVGSKSINYSDPTAPVLKKFVTMGGRSLSIYHHMDEGLDFGVGLQRQM